MMSGGDDNYNSRLRSQIEASSLLGSHLLNVSTVSNSGKKLSHSNKNSTLHDLVRLKSSAKPEQEMNGGSLGESARFGGAHDPKIAYESVDDQNEYRTTQKENGLTLRELQGSSSGNLVRMSSTSIQDLEQCSHFIPLEESEEVRFKHLDKWREGTSAGSSSNNQLNAADGSIRTTKLRRT